MASNKSGISGPIYNKNRDANLTIIHFMISGVVFQKRTYFIINFLAKIGK